MRRFVLPVLIGLLAPFSAAAQVPRALTPAEIEAFRGAVSVCWAVPPGPPKAQATVTVGFSLTQEGLVVDNDVALVSHSDHSPEAVQQAFEAVRRAILRCQFAGYVLPPEAYADWRDVELTFDPDPGALK